MLSSTLSFAFVFATSVAAQSSLRVVCVAGQCLQGVSNTTIGATVSAPGAATSLLLLPGQYTSNTNPELLHSIISASSASLTPSPGFSNSSSASAISLPLNVALQPGLSIYSSPLYSGQASFSPLPTSLIGNVSTPLSAGSLSLSSNVWVAVNSSTNNRIIFWDSIPDFGQLPSTSASSLSLVDMQSAACSPPCAGSGVCTASGSCTCPTGFNGTSCESCASGFFGPQCQQCPSGCTSCDDGISGSGRCLAPVVTQPPSSCNCVNGECGSNGQCTCLAGWTTATNGTACAKCATGFFLGSTGNCEVCGIGCAECADTTGDCVTCNSGLTQNPEELTQCVAPTTTNSAGSACPDGSFGNNGTCTACSVECQTCTGATSGDCIVCNIGSLPSNGSCLSPDQNGICQGSNLIANNNKKECDTCPPKCTACAIPNFTVASTIDQAQCTGCLPGFVLSQGKCVTSCPSNTFLSPQDNLTCTACDSSCTTCAGSSKFCLTCSNNQLASGGKCVSTCPSNAFSSSGICTTCHPDCATCSGPTFNQCSTCPSNLPVLTNGRCLPTCSKSQFFETTSSACQSCDNSCSSCSGPGPSNCLACSDSSHILRSGNCITASCTNSSSVVSGLGVCLSDMVIVPQASASGTAPGAPLPSGLNTPTSAPATTQRLVAWWQILLMALGCAFIFVAVLVCWRRRARKIRAKRTAAFASAKALDQKDNWRWKLVRFGEKLFGHAPSQRVYEHVEPEELRLKKLRAEEEARYTDDVEKIVGSYEDSRSHRASHDSRLSDSDHLESNRLSGGSLYSQVTGQPRRTAEPRQPVKRLSSSRFSRDTLDSNKSRKVTRVPVPPTETEAAISIMQPPEPKGWNSKNPFRC